MTEARRPELLDMVAVLASPDDPEIRTGNFGTVVELLPPDAVEVEFLGRDGHTRHVGALRLENVLALNRAPPRVA